MQHQAKQEKKLLAAIKNGDKQAYELLYTTYYNKLCVYAYSLTEDSKKAEDIVQEVLLKLWVNRKKITIHTSVNSFLYRSVHNLFLDIYRKNKRKHKMIQELQMEAVIEFETTEENDKEAKLARLRALIDKLPQKRKEIFILNKLQNYKYREIAQMRNISERTVEAQIRQALITLREAVAKQGNTLSTFMVALFSSLL